MAESKRFVKTYSQGGWTDNELEVWVDTKTGVNYLYSQSQDGHAGGLTPLLNRDGTPVVTPVPNDYTE